MADPPINMSDTTAEPSTPPRITTTYTNGANVISFPTTYALLKHLLAYPPCPHRDMAESPWPCSPCFNAFTPRFWDATATLLDYFADFLPTAPPLMQSLWFHLLDVWQSAALWPDHARVISDAARTPPTRRGARHVRRARQYARDVEHARKLFETVMYGPRKMARGSLRLSEHVIHAPDGVIWHGARRHETGPWVSGLKPWQQWLSAGSPGVVTGPWNEGEGEGEEGQGKGKGKGKARDQHKKKPPNPPRHIPMPALAIIKHHTHRARTHALTHASRDPATAPTTLAHFDAHSLRFPRAGKTAAYAALRGGRRCRYTLWNGAPPVSRGRGWLDEDLVVGKPGLGLVDECVGMCRGGVAYVAVSGEGDEGDEDADADADAEEDAEEDGEDSVDGGFDMWTVVERGEAVGEKNGLAEGLGDLFEEWLWGEREQRVDREMMGPDS